MPSEAVHELKTWPDAFLPLIQGRKKFEFRKNDRRFAVGDTLWLREWQPCDDAVSGFYSGQSVTAKVNFISRGPQYGIPDGYCVMSLTAVRRADRSVTNTATRTSAARGEGS